MAQKAATTGLVVAVLLTSSCGTVNSWSLPKPSGSIAEYCSETSGLIGGAEDIAPDQATDTFYVSSARWAETAVSGAPEGGLIYRLSRNPHTGRFNPPEDVTPKGIGPFHPHGLDLWTSGDGKTKQLFVVNHPPGQPSRIEIFSVPDQGRLVDTKAGRHYKLLHRPNDVVGVAKDAFLATNDHAGRPRRWFPPFSLEAVQDAFALRRGAVILVAAGAASEAKGGLAFPNGIARAPDGFVYVSESTTGRVLRFDVHERPDPAAAPRYVLRPAGVLEVGRVPDNLYVDARGRLWVAAHISVFRFADHVSGRRMARSRPAPSPSRIQRVDLKEAKPLQKTVYQTTPSSIRQGRGISAISIGVPAGPDTVLLGSIFERRVLECRIERS